MRLRRGRGAGALKMGQVNEARAPRQGKVIKQAGGKRPQKSGQANEPAPVCLCLCHGVFAATLPLRHSVTPSRPLLPTHLVPLLRLSLFMLCPSLCACVYLQSPWRTTPAPFQKAKTPKQADAGVADAQMHQTHATRTHLRSTGKARQGRQAGKARTHHGCSQARATHTGSLPSVVAKP
ncbi:hypothetical protein EDB80DRAFT_365754 [Ilyonectria destructans]|nr:hypothetical protein EDB80DRAFT_365754 [Ilyonectria destructans]